MTKNNCIQGDTPIDHRSKCPGGGKPNKCGIKAGRKQCWCFGYPKLDTVIDDDKSCLCEECFKLELDK